MTLAFSGAATWWGTVNQEGTFSVLARITSLDGSGQQVLPEEGNCLLPGDVSAITGAVFDLGTDPNNLAGTELFPRPTVTPSGNLFSPLRVAGWPTGKDQWGYNFRHDVPADYIATAGNWYLVEYKFTLLTGGIAWLRVKVKAIPIQTP